MAAIVRTSHARSVSFDLPSTHKQKEDELDSVDHHNCTKLYYAVRDHDEGEIERLLKLCASPFKGESLFVLIRNNVPLMLKILGCSGSHALQRCRDLEQLSDLLFPPYLNLTQDLWSSTQKCKFDANLSKFTDIRLDPETLMKRIVGDKTKLLEYNTYSVSLDQVKRALLETHPGFAWAWRSANIKWPLQLFLNPNVKTDFGYNFTTHTIEIGRIDSLKKVVKHIVFGTLLSLHRQTLLELSQKPFDRENFTVIRTYLNYRVEQQTKSICDAFFPEKTPYKTFTDYWNEINANGIAQTVRRTWDEFLFHKFFDLDTNYLHQRLDQLSKAEHDSTTPRKHIPESRFLFSPIGS